MNDLPVVTSLIVAVKLVVVAEYFTLADILSPGLIFSLEITIRAAG